MIGDFSSAEARLFHNHNTIEGHALPFTVDNTLNLKRPKRTTPYNNACYSKKGAHLDF